MEKGWFSPWHQRLALKKAFMSCAASSPSIPLVMDALG